MKPVIAGTLCALASSHAAGQCQIARLIAGDTVASDENFGTAIAMSPGVLVVGARQARVGGINDGAVYVYRKSGSAWAFETRLVPASASFKQFGSAAAIDGDVVAIGAPSESVSGASSGAAYIFRRVSGQWAQEAQLIMPDAVAGDRAGVSIAIAGDIAVVGVPFKSDIGTQVGAAYIFERAAGVWSSGTRIDANDGNDAMFFGSGVACSPDGGGLVIVGAINKNTGPGGAQGAVYIFRKTDQGWVRDPRLTPSDAAPGDAFGTFVSLSGSALLVGAFTVDGPAGVDQGAAYIFRAAPENTWNQEAKLLAADGASGDLFGSAGSISGDAAVLGAYHATVGGAPVAGAAYVFKKDGAAWTQSARVQASDPHAGDTFGIGAATDGVDAVMGAQFLDGVQPNSGAAYVYSLAACACYANCDGTTNSPILNVNDFQCFLNAFAAQDPYANCDNSTAPPILNANDFQCFLNKFAIGCT